MAFPVQYRAWNTSQKDWETGDSANHSVSVRVNTTTFVNVSKQEIATGVYEITMSDGDLPPGSRFSVYGTSTTDYVRLLGEGGVRPQAMRGTDAALLAANYTAPDNADVALIKSVTDKVDTALESDGASGWQLTTLALTNTPDIWSTGQRDQVLGYDSKIDSIIGVTDKVDTALESDGASGWQLTTLALDNTPDIWSAGQRDQVLGYDSKIDDIPSDVRTNFSTELARIDASISSRFAAGSYVAPNNSGISDILTAVQTDLPGQISGLPDVPAILVGLLDTVNSVDGFSLRQLLRGAGAAVLGELGGGGTSTETIHAMDGSKVRITATVDENGNRTNLVFDFD